MRTRVRGKSVGSGAASTARHFLRSGAWPPISGIQGMRLLSAALMMSLAGCGAEGTAGDHDTNLRQAKISSPQDARKAVTMNDAIGSAASNSSDFELLPDSYICLRETIESGIRRATGLPDEMTFGGPIFAALQRRLSTAGQPMSISGSSRFLSVNDSSGEPANNSYSSHCALSGNSIIINLAVTGNGSGGPYRLAWEVRQQSRVRSGVVERQGAANLPWARPPHPWNVFDHALRQEAELLGQDIAARVILERRNATG
jgi:hypothetical protein